MYADRIDAGLALVKALEKYRNDEAVILGVPRGGVPVAFAVAKAYGFPLDVVLIKKIGHPTHKEYAIGAVSLSERIIEPHEGVSEAYIEEETEKVREKLKQLQQDLKGNKPPVNIKGKTVIIIDDGIATGRTLSIAVDVIKKEDPAKIVIAVPVASDRAIEELSPKVDEIVCPLVPEAFSGVGAFYEDFTQTSNDQVKEYMAML